MLRLIGSPMEAYISCFPKRLGWRNVFLLKNNQNCSWVLYFTKAFLIRKIPSSRHVKHSKNFDECGKYHKTIWCKREKYTIYKRDKNFIFSNLKFFLDYYVASFFSNTWAIVWTSRTTACLWWKSLLCYSKWGSEKKNIKIPNQQTKKPGKMQKIPTN